MQCTPRSKRRVSQVMSWHARCSMAMWTVMSMSPPYSRESCAMRPPSDTMDGVATTVDNRSTSAVGDSRDELTHTHAHTHTKQ